MKTIINIIKAVLNALYAVLKLLPVQKKILFLSRQSNSPSIDIALLSERIAAEHPDYQTVILCRKIGPGLMGKISYCFHMLRQMYHLATSQAVILDSYAILVSLLKHRRSLLVIQMWHSVGTMKKFGYSILDQPEGSSSSIAIPMNMHKNYDYILCAGEGYRSHLAEGFNYPKDKVVILPLPRVAALQNKEFMASKRNEIYAAYPELRCKKNILYVPTFRKNESEKESFNEALASLKSAFEPFSSKYNLIIKAHPLSDIESDCKEFTSFDMLAAADYVISDYSCIIYEAAILHLPLYFYTYDYETYTETRDIYMDYPREIPSSMYSDPTALMKCIDTEVYDMERLERFLSKYVSYERPDIIGDIAAFIWTELK
ncbi:MAG: CDP-glycerol glycerophosphotransferase family protein [Bacillota bacterium]|nr:CDP-glycerol glycerophosphotransferase family protein [Bacillota bacterium]